MRHGVVVLVLTLVVAACGSESDDAAAEPTRGPTSTVSQTTNVAPTSTTAVTTTSLQTTFTTEAYGLEEPDESSSDSTSTTSAGETATTAVATTTTSLAPTSTTTPTPSTTTTTATSTTTTTTTSTTTTVPTTTTTVSTPSTTQVTIAGFVFSPQSVSISVGDTVRWSNADNAPHRVGPSGGSAWTGDLGNGESDSQTFNSAGNFSYICQIHPAMTGSVTVTP